MVCFYFLYVLIFRCVFLEQTPVCSDSFQLANDPRVLKIAIRHPNLDNTEILLRRNSDSVDMWQNIQVGWNCFSYCYIRQLLPCLIYFLVCNFVGETTAISVLGVFPHWNDALSHEKQHTIHYEFRRQSFKYCNCLLSCIKVVDSLITWSGPIRIMRQMRP